jgi:hypothetical protein
MGCVEQAGVADKVQCHNVAISDSDGHTVFQLPFHSASAQAGNTGAGIGREVKVEMRSIDSMGLRPADFMKIDAEGHEAAVLRGSLKTLRNTKPFIMFENKLYPQTPEETLQPLQLLIDAGYCLYVPTVQRACQGATYFVNCGYRVDTGRNQKIEREDTMALVPCEPAMRFLLPPYLNIFACHRDRTAELRTKFQPLA